MRQNIKRIPITKEGFLKLQKELESLKNERPRAVKNLSEARNMGDLSENGLYTAAKARLRSIDSQISRLDMQIKFAEILENKSNGVVGLNSKVEVLNNGKTQIFHIVGDFEANPKEFKISQYSPLGKSLIGKKVGDIAEVRAPGRNIEYKITSIK